MTDNEVNIYGETGAEGYRDIWPLDEVNVYGETRAKALARAERAVAAARKEVSECEGSCTHAYAEAIRARDDVKAGRVYDLSLDGVNLESWTIRADLAESSASEAINEHDNYCTQEG